MTAPGDTRLTDAQLTQDERRSLGCDCWRLDGMWHHKRGCQVPAVEAILRDRLPEATTVTEWQVLDEDGRDTFGPDEDRARRFAKEYDGELSRRTHTRYADHYGPWEQVTE